MVVSKIVDVDRDTKKYFLPPHRHNCLRTGQPGTGFALLSWAIPMNVAVLDELMECFKLDGPRGLSYDQYTGFHLWLKLGRATGFRWEILKARFDHIPGILQKMEEGISICDVGCSIGHVALTIAEKFPKSVIYGFDISEEAVALASQDANDKRLTNVTFGVNDLCALPVDWTNKWDLMMMWDVAHDVPQTSKALRETYRVLKPGGVVSMVDANMYTEHADNVDVRHARFIYGVSLCHCMPVSLYLEGGEGMGAAWGQEKAVQMLREAGFTDIKTFSKSTQYEMHFVLSKAALETD
ncbi:hypothetical protein LSAT2_014071 [Lamellibrachia satsuma]|nr:hypothetical protein LSAT2_014071 [Lamellibrachia satsuma]